MRGLSDLQSRPAHIQLFRERLSENVQLPREALRFTYFYSYQGLREAGPGSLTVTVKSVLAGLRLGKIKVTT